MNYLNKIMEKEKTDLELHVDLCAQRYAELDLRLVSVENKVDAIGHKIDSNRDEIMKVLIGTAGTILVSIMGLAGVILTKMG